MKRYLFLILAAIILAANSAVAGFRWAPKTDYRAPDKFSHFLAGNYLTAEFSQWRFAHGNRWVGFGIMSFLMDGVWEVKDGLLPYEKYGRIGAEGYDPRDVVMNTLGGLYGVRLHDQVFVWLGLKAKVEYPPLRLGACQRPVAELRPILGRRLLMAGIYVGGCAAYNYSRTGRPFPTRSAFYESPDQEVRFLETLNSESSFIIPWVTNAELRPFLPMYYRYPAMLAAVFAFEGANGLWDDRDVPWFGDRQGYKKGDIYTGVVSTHLVMIYDYLWYPKEVVCQPNYSVGPTPEGIGLVYADNSKTWTLSPNLSAEQLGLGFHLIR